MEIMGETGRWDFSLREVARRAVVSHNAPYSHFADKRALIAAIAVESYARLRESMLAAERGSGSAEEALEAISHAYIRFGLENPAFYRLMFGPDLQSASGLPEAVVEAAESARSVLRDVIHRGAEDGSFDVDREDPFGFIAAVIAAWSLVHGFTLLAIDGLVGRETTHDVERIGKALTRRFVRGWAGQPKADPQAGQRSSHRGLRQG